MMRSVITKSIDGAANLARRHFHGSRVHRWRITNWLYLRLMRITQASDAQAGELDVTFRGYRFITSAMDVTVTPTLRDGSYEQAEIDAWLQVIQPGDHVVDVGANIGVFTVLSAQRVGTAGVVTAFEPEPGNIARLRSNISANGLENVEVREACVGDTDGSVTLYVQDGQSGSHSVVRPDGATPLTVDVVRLDSAISTRPVSALKIDVEGFEAAVLRGASGIIRTDRPAILLEYNGGAEMQTFVNELITTGGYSDCMLISRRRQVAISPQDLPSLENLAGLGNLLLRAPRNTTAPATARET
jgi:FkbM family methyltransferase